MEEYLEDPDHSTEDAWYKTLDILRSYKIWNTDWLSLMYDEIDGGASASDV